MSRSALRHLGLVGPFAVAATLGLGTLPAFAQTAPSSTDCSAIRFELANPSPGSRIEPGGYVLQGIAQDSRAQQGAGIDRIDFFLDNRDLGGTNVGAAVVGAGPGPFGPDSFQTTLSVPSMIGGHDLFGYAHSSVTGQEITISMPIAVGEDPSKAGETANSSATETCTAATGANTTSTTPVAPVAEPASTTPASATTPASTTATTPAMSPAASSMVFEIANPSPGDTIHVGGTVIEGVAYDREAQGGTGVDRIQVFLDNRDNAGILVGEASLGDMNVLRDNGDEEVTLVAPGNAGDANAWSATVNLPSNQTGMHMLFFYAHSAITGAESIVIVPVTVAP